MLGAGFDMPYVQSQVGHSDPAVKLAVYAPVIRRPDRDQLRAEMRVLLSERAAEAVSQTTTHGADAAAFAHTERP